MADLISSSGGLVPNPRQHMQQAFGYWDAVKQDLESRFPASAFPNRAIQESKVTPYHMVPPGSVIQNTSNLPKNKVSQ